MPVKPMKSSSVSRQMIALRHRLEYVQLEIERLAQRCDHAGTVITRPIHGHPLEYWCKSCRRTVGEPTKARE